MKTYTKTGFIFILSLLASCSNKFDDLLFSMVTHPQEPEVRNYEIRSVEFINPKDNIKISAELTYPSNGRKFSGKFPRKFTGIVLVSGHQLGAPPFQRNYDITGHKYFLVISDMLTKRGYAVLRFDNRGVGKSGGDYLTATDLDYASDAAAALKWLKNDSDLSLSKSGFLGHSQGGIKSLLASRIEPSDFIVSLAGVSVETIAQALIQQNKDMNNANNIDASITRQQTREYEDVFEILRTSNNIETAKKNLKRYVIHSGVTEKQQVKKTIELFTSVWLFNEAHRDPVLLIKNYQAPVLALFGSKDLLVSAAVNAEPTRQILSHPDSEVLTFSGLNHLFQTAIKSTGPNEYWEIETTIEARVIDKIDHWIKTTIDKDDND